MNRYDLMDALNRVDEAQLEATGRFFESGKEQIMKRKTIRTVRIVLIAAVITSLLSVTAYAVSQFSMRGRPVRTGETFTWTYNDTTREWPCKYVFEFEGPTECPEVEFRAGWAPTADYWGWLPENRDGWGTLYEAKEIYNEELGVYMPACVIDVCYAPQFVNGGAMILMDFTPNEIVEEEWDGGVRALCFTAVAGHAIDREQTVFPTGSFVILFYPEQGWIIGVRGYDSMENIEHIARSLEVRALEKTVTQADFMGEREVEFGDIYIG